MLRRHHLGTARQRVAALASLTAAHAGLVHHRIPPRSPSHYAVCERFHGTVLTEFFRPHFHRGRTPLQVTRELKQRLRQTAA